jgi:hypothetical protein
LNNGTFLFRLFCLKYPKGIRYYRGNNASNRGAFNCIKYRTRHKTKTLFCFLVNYKVNPIRKPIPDNQALKSGVEPRPSLLCVNLCNGWFNGWTVMWTQWTFVTIIDNNEIICLIWLFLLIFFWKSWTILMRGNIFLCCFNLLWWIQNYYFLLLEIKQFVKLFCYYFFFVMIFFWDWKLHLYFDSLSRIQQHCGYWWRYYWSKQLNHLLLSLLK